jgi:hypothetical protein
LLAHGFTKFDTGDIHETVFRVVERLVTRRYR